MIYRNESYGDLHQFALEKLYRLVSIYHAYTLYKHCILIVYVFHLKNMYDRQYNRPDYSKTIYKGILIRL
jgi:hypothetical protein